MDREGTPWFKKLTVYSGVVTGQRFEKSGVRTARISEMVCERGSGKVNLVLFAIALTLIVSFVFISNFVVSQKYALNAAKLELGGISSDLVVERDGKVVEPAITKVMDYAQKSGMIETRVSDSIVEDFGFAISTPNIQ